MKTKHKRLALVIAGILTAVVMIPSVATASSLKQQADSQANKIKTHGQNVADDSAAVRGVLIKVNATTCKSVADKALDDAGFSGKKAHADSEKGHVDSGKAALTALKTQATSNLTSTIVNEENDATSNLATKASAKTSAYNNMVDDDTYQAYLRAFNNLNGHVCSSSDKNNKDKYKDKCNSYQDKLNSYNDSRAKKAYDAAVTEWNTATTRKTAADNAYNPLKDDLDYVTAAEKAAIAQQTIAVGHQSSVTTKSNDINSAVSDKKSVSKTVHWDDDVPGDSNRRGYGDSATNEAKQKVTICHIPKGNPNNAHTIHISYSAWAAHQKHIVYNDNNPSKGIAYQDYLGSCNRKSVDKEKLTVRAAPATDDTCGVPVLVATTVDNTVIAEPKVATDTELAQFPSNTTDSYYVSCKGSAYAALKTNVEKYFDPIVVDDTAITDTSLNASTSTATQAQLDNAEVVAALSQCLDYGDSGNPANRVQKSDSDAKKGATADDSGKNSSVRTDAGKGYGHLPADSGRHYHVGPNAADLAKDPNDKNVYIQDDSGNKHKYIASDSGKHKSIAISDSGNHKSRLILNCKNKDTSNVADSSSFTVRGSKMTTAVKDIKNANFRQKLEHADSDRAFRNKNKELHISDSSLDDKDVWTAVTACIPSATNSKRIDSGKLGAKKGDSGHKYRPLTPSAANPTGCVSDTSGAKANAVNDAIEAYKNNVASSTTTPKTVLLTKTSYQTDASIHEAVNDCLDDGGTITPDPKTTPTDTVTPVCTGSACTPCTGPTCTTSGSAGAQGNTGRLNWREINRGK